MLAILGSAGDNAEVSIPDSLPSLSHGAHDSGDGEACVMEYVSLLAGEVWSDRPECTHPILAHEARMTNDLLLDHDRQRLVPLIGRLFGTTEDSATLRTELRLAQAGQIIALLEPTARSRAQVSVARAEAWLEREGGAEDHREAFSEAMAIPLISGELDPAHEQFHHSAAHIYPLAMSSDLEPGEASALSALAIAHRIAGSGECRADCGNEPARARRMVKDLAGLLDVYDRVTGRTDEPFSPDAVRELIRTSG